ncbi:MAG: SDR family NAD(P)-dependent oxidoreductase [Gemmatimonadaceae bacterium]
MLDEIANREYMKGRVCVVTGANRGLGKATALGLAKRGATVVMLCRDARSGATASDEIKRDSGNESVSVIVADLASFDSIRRAAAEVGARHGVVHVLVNNAGVNPARRARSADGIEMIFAVNHLGPFLLTNLLLPLLHLGVSDSRDARVVTVTSEFERFGRVTFDDVQRERGYIGLLAYTQSKLANVLFTYELAARLAGSGVTATCVYPGLVATDLMRDRLWWRPRWLRTLWNRVLLAPEAGAAASLYAATAPELRGVTGQCIDRRGRRVRTSGRSHDRATRERLWRLSEGMVGLGNREWNGE